MEAPRENRNSRAGFIGPGQNKLEARQTWVSGQISNRDLLCPVVWEPKPSITGVLGLFLPLGSPAPHFSLFLLPV